MPSKILCPIDFSSCATRAVELTAELAQPLQAEVDLLHVYEVPLLAVPDAPLTVDADYLTAIQQKAKQALEQQKQALQARGLTVTTYLLQGSPTHMIVDHAKAHRPTLIVMGTHGRSGFKHMMLGSVAERVVRTANVPVLTTRATDQLPAAATIPIKDILVGYDFSEGANRALVHAGVFAKKLGATLHVAHVHPDFTRVNTSHTSGVPWPTADQTERYISFLYQELQRKAEAMLPEQVGKIRCHVLRGDPVKMLENAAEDVNAGLLCVGSTGKGAVQRVLLGSISQLLIRSSKIPVLTLH